MSNSARFGHQTIGYKVLGAVIGLILLDLAVWFGLNVVGRYQLRHYERKMEAKGEHFNFADFIPKPVPPARNFAFAPIVASSYEADLDKSGHAYNPKRPIVNRLKMDIYIPKHLLGDWSLQKPTDLKGLQAYFRTVADAKKNLLEASQAQNPGADILQALSKYEKPLADLQAASSLPDSRFPLNYDADPPVAILLPHLASLKQCCQVLQLRAIVDLRNGQNTAALADLKLAFRLIDSVHSESLVVSQLARANMLHALLQPIWEGTRDHEWSDAQLAELESNLSGFDFLSDCEASERTERTMLLATIDYVRRTRQLGIFSDSDGETPIPLSELPILRFGPDFIYYQNELKIAQAYQEWFLPAVDTRRKTVSPEIVNLGINHTSQIRKHYEANNILAGLALPVIEKYIQRFAYAQSSVDMVRIACALERFHLLHGSYPDKLAALTPKYLSAVPHDVIGGQPLKFYPTANGGFVLYSVGWNETDDNGQIYVTVGVTREINLPQGDWVWSDATPD